MILKRIKIAFKVLTAGHSLKNGMKLYLDVTEFSNELAAHLEEKAIDAGEATTLRAFQGVVDDRLKEIDARKQ